MKYKLLRELTEKEEREGEKVMLKFMKDTGLDRDFAEHMLEINLERDPLFLCDYELVRIDN